MKYIIFFVMHEKVYVENQTDKVLITAFGVNKNPDWEEQPNFFK